MADQITTPALTLSSEVQLLLINKVNALLDILKSPATDIAATLSNRGQTPINRLNKPMNLIN